MRDNKNRNQSESQSTDRLDLYDDDFAEESDEIEEDVGTPRSLMLVDQRLYATHEDDRRRSLLYELRRAIIEDEVTFQEARQAIVEMQETVDKLTAPANRIGTLLGFPKKGIARVIVGGSDYLANIDSQVGSVRLQDRRQCAPQ